VNLLWNPVIRAGRASVETDIVDRAV
jgi:hypothetical protein